MPKLLLMFAGAAASVLALPALLPSQVRVTSTILAETEIRAQRDSRGSAVAPKGAGLQPCTFSCNSRSSFQMRSGGRFLDWIEVNMSASGSSSSSSGLHWQATLNVNSDLSFSGLTRPATVWVGVPDAQQADGIAPFRTKVRLTASGNNGQPVRGVFDVQVLRSAATKNPSILEFAMSSGSQTLLRATSAGTQSVPVTIPASGRYEFEVACKHKKTFTLPHSAATEKDAWTVFVSFSSFRAFYTKRNSCAGTRETLWPMSRLRDGRTRFEFRTDVRGAGVSSGVGVLVLGRPVPAVTFPFRPSCTLDVTPDLVLVQRRSSRDFYTLLFLPPTVAPLRVAFQSVVFDLANPQVLSTSVGDLGLWQ